MEVEPRIFFSRATALETCQRKIFGSLNMVAGGCELESSFLREENRHMPDCTNMGDVGGVITCWSLLRYFRVTKLLKLL